MKKIYILIFVIIFGSISAFGGESKTISIDGVTREYKLFLPDKPTGTPQPLIVFLHGLGQKIAEYEGIAQQMANATGSVFLLPQALDEQSTNIKTLINLAKDKGGLEIPAECVWSAGLSVTLDALAMELSLSATEKFALQLLLPSGKAVLNANVNDLGFLNGIINEAKASFSINPSRIYMIGASLGGAMTYRYAYSAGSQVSAIAVIAGFIGAEVDHSGSLNIPVCIFHSQNDQVVPYSGGLFNRPIPDIVDEIGQKRGCTGTPSVYNFPDIAPDGVTVQSKTYNCNPELPLKFYILSGAAHALFMTSDYTAGPNDMDYMTEVWKFFEEAKPNSVETIRSVEPVSFYPNPAKENITFTVSGSFELKEMTGKTILKGNAVAGEMTSLENIPSGIYIITLKSDEGMYSGKLIVK